MVLKKKRLLSDLTDGDLKSKRVGSGSLLTLFGNKGAWKIDKWLAIKKYGNNGKMQFTMSKKPNKNGLYVCISSDDTISVKHITDGIIIEWKLNDLFLSFINKVKQILLVSADYKKENDTEYFHYNVAELYFGNTTPLMLKSLINEETLKIDMTLKFRK